MSRTMGTLPLLRCVRWKHKWKLIISQNSIFTFIFLNSLSLSELWLLFHFHFLTRRAANITRHHCCLQVTISPRPLSTIIATSSPPPTTTTRLEFSIEFHHIFYHIYFYENNSHLSTKIILSSSNLLPLHHLDQALQVDLYQRCLGHIVHARGISILASNGTFSFISL